MDASFNDLVQDAFCDVLDTLGCEYERRSEQIGNVSCELIEVQTPDRRKVARVETREFCGGCSVSVEALRAPMAECFRNECEQLVADMDDDERWAIRPFTREKNGSGKRYRHGVKATFCADTPQESCELSDFFSDAIPRAFARGCMASEDGNSDIASNAHMC